MTVFQWSVFEADLDSVTGSVQRGIRPVLIVSNEEFNQAMPNITVLPLTSTRRRKYPSEVFLPAIKAKQPLDSIILAHQVRTIAKERLIRYIGHLEDLNIQLQVLQAIKEHFDLE